MLVYKYRGGAFERDLNSLKNDEFWASNTSQLNDPCEGLIAIDKRAFKILCQPNWLELNYIIEPTFKVNR